MRTRGLLAVALVTACSGGDSSSVPAQPVPKTTEAVPAPAPKPEEPATVRGVVRWGGEKIEPQRLTVGDEYHKSAVTDGWLSDQRFEVAPDGALPHAFVWAQKGPHRTKTWDVPATPVELLADRGMHVPHVFGIIAGQSLRVRSGGGTNYCFHARPMLNEEFYFSLGPGDQKTVSFSKAEKAIPISDNCYSWMRSYVFVLDHPFFAVTDAQGRFEIRGLPPGEYVFKVWHESMTADYKAHETETTVTLASGAAADIAVELR